jgi:hypothetical protein
MHVLDDGGADLLTYALFAAAIGAVVMSLTGAC